MSTSNSNLVTATDAAINSGMRGCYARLIDRVESRVRRNGQILGLFIQGHSQWFLFCFRSVFIANVKGMSSPTESADGLK